MKGVLVGLLHACNRKVQFIINSDYNNILCYGIQCFSERVANFLNHLQILVIKDLIFGP